MTAKLNLAFALAILLFFAWTLVEAQHFRAQARLFPVVIGVTGLLLTAVYLVAELVRVRRLGRLALEPAPASSLDTADDELAGEAVPAAVRRRRTYAILGWILGFTLAAWLLGFIVAVPLVTLAYLRFGARESWRLSAAYAVASGLLFYGLFDQVVHIPFEPGLLLSLLPA
jgi:hypothetical protein